MCVLLRLPSLFPLLYLALFYREKTDRTPIEHLMDKKVLFLRLSPKKVDLIPKKVDSFPKKVDSHPKMVNLQFLHEHSGKKFAEKFAEKFIEKFTENT